MERVLTINAYRYTSATANKLARLLQERGANLGGVLWRSECGYLALCLNKARPHEFIFVPKDAISRIKQVPSECWGTWEVLRAALATPIQPQYDEKALKTDPFIKDALVAWVQGDYEEALRRPSSHAM